MQAPGLGAEIRRAGQLDAFAGAFLTQERLNYADYLQPPLLQTTSKVWCTKNVLLPSITRRFKGRTGVTVINNSFGQTFDDFAKTELKIQQVGSVQQALKMLESKRVDYFIYEEQPGLAYIDQFQTKNLVLLPYVISSEPLYLALSKRSPCNTEALKQQLSQALQQAAQNHWAEHSLEAARMLWRQNPANTPHGATELLTRLLFYGHSCVITHKTRPYCRVVAAPYEKPVRFHFPRQYTKWLLVPQGCPNCDPLCQA